MNLVNIKKTLNSLDYNFLRDDKHLGNNIILLALGGSHAYGMDKEDSDIDLRGIALNTKEEILLGMDFEKVVEKQTDTTIYSVNRMLKLLENSNPNTIEILGVKPEHYIHKTSIGDKIIENRHAFLSKICIFTFSGYAEQQLRRLENKSARLVSQSEREVHILKTIENAAYEFKQRYLDFDADNFVKLYIDESLQKDFDTEIYFDACFKHYPLRDWVNMWNEMKSIVGSYTKMGKRNENAISHDKLGKHMAHLIRLYMMCIDILTKEEIITYRADEHNLLMSIRNGEYLDENRQPIPAFFDILNDYSKRLEEAKKTTKLPDLPDRNTINKLRLYINEQIVKGEMV